MSKLSDNDSKFGPLTWSKSSWNPLRLVFSTGGDDEGHPRNHLTGYAFGWVARLDLPTKVKPWRRWVDTSHYDWAKGPNSGYWDVHAREYGFSLHEGFLQISHGPQTHDSTTTKSWSKRLPWTQWRHVRRSLYDAEGKHFYSQFERARMTGREHWEEQQCAEAMCPTLAFEFEDYDGQRITATTRIEEREWRFGEGWFKWLSLFRPRKIRRSLDLSFSAEVGPEKGSWKGGTMGHGIEMLKGEDHEGAFRRYCDQDHRSKYQPFRIKFITRAAAQLAQAAQEGK